MWQPDLAHQRFVHLPYTVSQTTNLLPSLLLGREQRSSPTCAVPNSSQIKRKGYDMHQSI